MIKIQPTALKQGPKIGSGASSTVYHCRFSGKDVAVKFFNALKTDSARKEIEILFELRHPNVVGILGWFQTVPKMRGHMGQIGIVMELW